MRDGYYADWQGKEYEVSPDGSEMRLYSTEPEEGFVQVRPGRYVLEVLPADQVANFAYIRTTCTWQGEPFIVLGESDGWLRLEYTGGKAPVAHPGPGGVRLRRLPGLGTAGGSGSDRISG